MRVHFASHGLPSWPTRRSHSDTHSRFTLRSIASTADLSQLTGAFEAADFVGEASNGSVADGGAGVEGSPADRRGSGKLNSICLAVGSVSHQGGGFFADELLERSDPRLDAGGLALGRVVPPAPDERGPGNADGCCDDSDIHSNLRGTGAAFSPGSAMSLDAFLWRAEQRAPAFANSTIERAAQAERATVELRAETPREVVDVLDAVSQAQGMSRTHLWQRVLREWALDQLHKHTVVARVIEGNPLLTELSDRRTR